MRVAFLCSSLEPGRDGVGDYCRRLGSELSRKGHDILLFSLNDRWQSDQKHEIESSTSVWRFGKTLPLAHRKKFAQAALQNFCPDWVSLQYVCFGYHPRGLAWHWNRIFTDLGRTAKQRHLMLHELWIGPPPWHRWFVGLGQRCVIRDLRKQFNPNLVSTTLSSYSHRLSGLGIKAVVLPLFGNIPRSQKDDELIARLLHALGCQLIQKQRTDFLHGVIFGTVHSNFNAQPLVKWLNKLYLLTKKPILLVLIGRTGPAAEQLTQRLQSASSIKIEVISLGEQSEQVVSQALQFADFGINTGSSELLGKSGTFAAMQEHGLPVVLADGKLDMKNGQDSHPPVLQFSHPDSVGTLVDCSRLNNSIAGVSRTANELIRLFESARG